MREIKFRVYDTVNKCFISDMSNFWINPSFTAMMEWRPEFDGQMTFDLNDSLIFQQYTGLTDQNGREIYEGDILSFSKDSMEDYIVHAIVRYGTGQFDGGVYKYTGFYLESTGDDVNLKRGDIMEPYEITNLHNPKWHHYEVVGNIFEEVDK